MGQYTLTKVKVKERYIKEINIKEINKEPDNKVNEAMVTFVLGGVPSSLNNSEYTDIYTMPTPTGTYSSFTTAITDTYTHSSFTTAAIPVWYRYPRV